MLGFEGRILTPQGTLVRWVDAEEYFADAWGQVLGLVRQDGGVEVAGRHVGYISSGIPLRARAAAALLLHFPLPI
jgi:hypothetical protein